MAIPLHSNLDALGAARIVNLPAPSANEEPARKIDLENAVQGIKNKDSCFVATSSNINLASPGATLDGETMTADDRVLVRGQTNDEENGIYIWNGAAVPMTRALDANTETELTNAIVQVTTGTDADTTWRQTATIATLETDPVTWASWGSSTPAASETTAGKIEIATQAETDTGTDDLRAITPNKLANWSGRYQAGGTQIGDGAATQFDITHNYGTRNVGIMVMQTGSPYQQVWVDAKANTTNAVRINFLTAPTSNEFTVLVWKVG